MTYIIMALRDDLEDILMEVVKGPFQSENEFKSTLGDLNQRYKYSQAFDKQMRQYESIREGTLQTGNAARDSLNRMMLSSGLGNVGFNMLKNQSEKYKTDVDLLLKRIDDAGIKLEKYNDQLYVQGANSSMIFYGEQYREKK